MCHMYPFVLVGVNIDAQETSLIALTSQCPPIIDLKNKGVTYVNVHDVAELVQGKIIPTVPILGESFKSLTTFSGGTTILVDPETGVAYFPLW